MIKHFMISCISFSCWGISITTMIIGKNINIWLKFLVFACGLAFYLYASIAHVPKVMKFINEHEKKPPMFDFEQQKN